MEISISTKFQSRKSLAKKTHSVLSSSNFQGFSNVFHFARALRAAMKSVKFNLLLFLWCDRRLSLMSSLGGNLCPINFLLVTMNLSNFLLLHLVIYHKLPTRHKICSLEIGNDHKRVRVCFLNAFLKCVVMTHWSVHYATSQCGTSPVLIGDIHNTSTHFRWYFFEEINLCRQLQNM